LLTFKRTFQNDYEHSPLFWYLIVKRKNHPPFQGINITLQQKSYVLQDCDVELPALHHSAGKTWFTCNTRTPRVMVARGFGCATVIANLSQWYAGQAGDVIFAGGLVWSSCSLPRPWPLRGAFWCPLAPKARACSGNPREGGRLSLQQCHLAYTLALLGRYSLDSDLQTKPSVKRYFSSYRATKCHQKLNSFALSTGEQNEKSTEGQTYKNALRWSGKNIKLLNKELHLVQLVALLFASIISNN